MPSLKVKEDSEKQMLYAGKGGLHAALPFFAERLLKKIPTIELWIKARKMWISKSAKIRSGELFYNLLIFRRFSTLVSA